MALYFLMLVKLTTTFLWFKMKKDTLQNLESVLKVILKVTALSIASHSVILVTRPICLRSFRKFAKWFRQDNEQKACRIIKFFHRHPLIFSAILYYLAEKVFHLLYFLNTVKKTTFFRQEKARNIQYHYLYTPNFPKITTKLSIYPLMKNLNND